LSNTSKYSTWGQAATKAKPKNATTTGQTGTGPTNRAKSSGTASSWGDTEAKRPSRTTAQAKRAEAAFGTRRTGPPAKNTHYSTSVRTNVFEGAAPDPPGGTSINRSTSSINRKKSDILPPPPTRQQSTSVGKSDSVEKSSTESASQSRASARYSPNPLGTSNTKGK
jgi:hypothetical protein